MSVLALMVVVRSKNLNFKFSVFDCIDNLDKHMKAYLIVSMSNRILILKILKQIFKTVLKEANMI